MKVSKNLAALLFNSKDKDKLRRNICLNSDFDANYKTLQQGNDQICQWKFGRFRKNNNTVVRRKNSPDKYYTGINLTARLKAKLI